VTSIPYGSVVAGAGTAIALSDNPKTLARLDAAAARFAALPIRPLAVPEDLGTDRAGRPTLVLGTCRQALSRLCTRLLDGTVQHPIAAIDPARCLTESAAIDRGRLALAVVAKPGRRGAGCHAGVYLRQPGASRARLRHAVAHWGFMPAGSSTAHRVFDVRPTVDLEGGTVLVRVEESTWLPDDSSDFDLRLLTVPVGPGPARVLAQLHAHGDGVTTTQGSILPQAQLADGAVIGVLRCAAGETPVDTIVRIPLGTGPDPAAMQQLTPAPAIDPFGAGLTPAGLVAVSATGAAILRPTADLTFAPYAPTPGGC
jgi:hypothetical protein